MEHFTDLVASLAWPAALVWIAYLFRDEVRGLFGRVSQFKFRDLEANFERELGKIEREKVAEADSRGTNDRVKSGDQSPPKGSDTLGLRVESVPSSPLGDPVYPPPYDDRYQQLLRIAEISQSAAILEAWTQLEVSISRALPRFGRGFVPSKVRGTLNNLYWDGHISKLALVDYDSLRDLRNQVAHARAVDLSSRSARRYIEIAIERCIMFDKLTPKVSPTADTAAEA